MLITPYQLQLDHRHLQPYYQDGRHSGSTGHVMIPYGHGANHNGLSAAPVHHDAHAGKTPHHVPNVMLTQGGHPETHHAPTVNGSRLGLQSSSGTPPYAHHASNSSQAIVVKQHSGPPPQPNHQTVSPHGIYAPTQHAPHHGEATVSFPHSLKPCPIQVVHAIIKLARRDTADGRSICRTPSTACKAVRPCWHRRCFSER